MLEIFVVIASAVSAVGVLATALIMFWQTNLARKQNINQIERLTKAQEQENLLSAAKNKIIINQMINDFNRMIIEGDEDLRNQIGSRMFLADASLLKRIYLQFTRLNIIDSALLLKKSNGMSKSSADEFISALSKNLNSDPEATKLALARGYSPEFIEEIAKYASSDIAPDRSELSPSERESPQ